MGLDAVLAVARKNWDDYRAVFEHGDEIATNPLLVNRDCFAHFLTEYSVSRTIRQGTHDKLREFLRDSPQFEKVIHDDNGGKLDEFETELYPDFGTHEPPRHIISVLSKVAAFVRPDRFVAWDQYAKKGVNIVLGRRGSPPFKAYADYLAAFDEAWNGQAGRQIREYLTRVGATDTVEGQPRFLRRVLDVHLMECGGRELKGELGGRHIANPHACAGSR
jgi:hypothetical protein